MSTGKLSALAVKNAKAEESPKKLSDGGGMFLLVNQTGKYWRLAYRFGGKQKTLALGTYPEVTLEAARRARDDARQLLKSKIDPGMERKLDKLTARHKSENTFEAVAREWHQKFKVKWTDHTANKNIRILELNAFPWLGARPIGEIKAPELLAVIRRVEERGLLDTAHRLRFTAGQVCFWHQHAGCPYAKMPSSRVEFWRVKLDGNVQRDLLSCRTPCVVARR